MSTTMQSNVYRQRRAVREDDEVMMEVTLHMANMSIGDEHGPFNWQTGNNNAPPSERSGAAESQPAKSRRKMNNLRRQRKEAKPKRKKNNFSRRRAVREVDDDMMEVTLQMSPLSIEDEPCPMNWQTSVNNAPPSERSEAADDQPAKPHRKRNNLRRQCKEAKPKRKKNNFRRRRAVREDKPMNERTRLMANLSIGDQQQTGVNNASACKRSGAADDESTKPQRKRANKRTLDASPAAHDHSPDRKKKQHDLETNKGRRAVSKRRTSDGPSLVIVVKQDIPKPSEGTERKPRKGAHKNRHSWHRMVQVMKQTRRGQQQRSSRRSRAGRIRSLNDKRDQ